ncbi:hypothetical protein [Oceanomicrobium pacificus]|uniref:Uncharacterized protein n=1 Tax=Oceanomicrobium pacificus TaxID=2692916 RepID=A0A6B0TK67_9RHOB|nr:hypothetical protein [Oceanomicrobium pacificus]MXU64900.1 hypothetical protein [Oceanomicrobium pacificus]
MDDPGGDSGLAERQHRQRRLQDAALLLPLVGAFFLISPVILIFRDSSGGEGVPAVVVYLFSVWLGLIVAAALLSRSFLRQDTHEDG